MFCKKAILVNWGNIPNLEFEFGPVNLFSGGNGSGKTTAADALQTLMTAAYENLFTYNPGQDETTQRGRGGKQVRTLASYVLGCDDGSYSRPKVTDGYVAGIFHPTHGENGQVFTAMLGVRAEIETVGKQRQARQRDLQFFILPGIELDMDLLCSESKVTRLDELADLLRKNYGKNQVESYDKKGLYLNRLYGALRGVHGSVPKREAQHAAKTFSNFMAYKPVKSINDFVAHEILEPKDLSTDIKQVSELMRTIHEMESETRQIKQVVDNLHSISDLANAYTQHWIDWRVCEYKEGIRASHVRQQHYLSLKGKQQATEQAIRQHEERIRDFNDKRGSLHQHLVTLQAQRLGIEALKDKDQLESTATTLRQRLSEQAQPLLIEDQQLSRNVAAVNELVGIIKESDLCLDVKELSSADTRRCLNRVRDAGESTGIDMQSLFTQDLVGIENLEHKLDALREFENAHLALATRLHNRDAAHTSLRDKVMAVAQQRLADLQRLKQQHQTKQREVQQLGQQRISYPHDVEQALKAIQQECPQARPSVLCDFISINDANWQMAIEGYIGGNRFAIIVEPDHEAEAIRIVRGLRNSGRRNKAKIIQGHKVQSDASRMSVPSNSILEVMQFDHKTAEYYVKGSYANVLRVESEHSLRNTARGITEDGLGSGGYSMFRCDIDDSELVFGSGARERALQARQAQLQTTSTELHSKEAAAKQAAACVQVIDQIKAIKINQLVSDLLSNYRQLQQAERELSQLDLSDFNDLETQLDEQSEAHAQVEHLLKDEQTELGRAQNELLNLTRKVQHIADEQDRLQAAVDAAETVVETIASVHADFDAAAALEQAQASATEHAKQSDADDDFGSEQAHHELRCSQIERQLDKAVLQHNEICRQADSIVYLSDTGSDGSAAHNFEWLNRIVVVTHESASITNRLRNNVLVGKHEKLADLKESFNTAFVSNLCHSIYQAINDGERTLNELNTELENHLFGTDREKYHFAHTWVPEFKEYHRFFKDVINLPSLGDGSSLFDADLSPQSAVIRDRLLAMLLDNDEQTAQRELKRISDYRNYRDYEIFKTPLGKEPIALSQYGTGSGGQLETPAYIIRSAAVTSAFKFSEGNTHCRMVLVDEAFSKMDETRSREVIHYLTDKLGLQLIFIMPTSKSGPFMDLISHQTIFSKCPTVEKVGELNTQVLVDRRICNQEKIKELWAKHRRTIRNQASLDFMQEFVSGDLAS